MNLYYISKSQTIRTLPATENRRKNVTPMFYETYREALIALKKVLEDRVNNDVKRMVEIEYEIAKI